VDSYDIGGWEDILQPNHKFFKRLLHFVVT